LTILVKELLHHWMRICSFMWFVTKWDQLFTETILERHFIKQGRDPDILISRLVRVRARCGGLTAGAAVCASLTTRRCGSVLLWSGRDFHCGLHGVRREQMHYASPDQLLLNYNPNSRWDFRRGWLGTSVVHAQGSKAPSWPLSNVREQLLGC
jgi:hypothetical protein